MRGDPTPESPICCSQDFDGLFDSVEAQHDLDAYHATGPPAASRRLIALLAAEGIVGATVIDVGAGVGVVHLELLATGAASAVDVDASHAFLQVAAEEAQRQDRSAQVEHHYGDFVQIAPSIARADVVTLDRVICCYPRVTELLGAAAGRARRLIGIVHPVDTWWSRSGAAVFNAISDLFRRRHHFYVHRLRTVDSVLATGGFEPLARQRAGFWEVSVYRAAG